MPSNSLFIFASNRLYGLVSSRLDIMKRLQQKGHEILACGGYDESAKQLDQSKIPYWKIRVQRGGFSPIADVKSIIQITFLLLRLKPQAIHCFNAKTILFFGFVSSFLLRNNERKMFYTITGLGMSLKNDSLTSKLAAWGYEKILTQSNATTIFQNHDDYQFFLKNGWINGEHAKVIVSSGVDTKLFKPAKSGLNKKIKIVFVGRLLWDKGVKEFLDAAEMVGEQRDDVEFIIAGEIDDNHPNSVTEEYIFSKSRKEYINYLGYINNMPDFLASADIFVFPSYYREGVPRVNLEAAACGLPVITCNSAGCKETVVDGENGYLIESKDSNAIAKRVIELVENPDLYQYLSRNARSFMIEKFDKEIIINQYLKLY